jgi:hypothetical protein
MKLVFTPSDGPREEYDFIPGKLLTSEAEAIEDLRGARWDTFEEFGRLFLSGNARARRAALWVMKRRREPLLEFDSMEFPLDQLSITFSDDEAARYEQSIRENPMLDEEEKEMLIKTLDLSTHNGELKDGTDLKDPSPSSGADASTSARPVSRPVSKNSTAGRSKTPRKR